ncbi:MAG: hypothetical protein ACOYB1_13280 [Limnohabitans sp.]
MNTIKIGTLSRVLTAACVSVWLCACSVLPHEEYMDFTPVPASQRIMNTVKISWEMRDDVADYCAKAKGMSKDAAFLTPPIACAVWSTPRKECTIVTGTKTSHTALGHEMRHCFEGHFH